MSRSLFNILAGATLVLVVAGYANHFDNGFHFDDSYAIVENPAIRSLHNIPRFFTDATTSGVLPQNQAYRPVLQTTLAIDYGIAGGYTPRTFQITSLLWFILQLGLMYLLFAQVLARAWGVDARVIGLLGTALYAVHPVGAETVNYIIQRGEILSTVGVIGALVLYARRPSWRRSGLYLLPYIIGVLAKPPAMVFPLLVFVYAWLFEASPPQARARAGQGRGIVSHAAMAALPALLVTAVLGWWLAHNTPAAYTTGASSTKLYLLSQGWVAIRYAVSAVAPLWLSADNDWQLATGWSDWHTIVGLLFIVGVAVLAARLARDARKRAMSFGLWWYLIALAPTSFTPLAEVANDHRMFFPFVGLALAAAEGAALVWQRLSATWRRPVVALTVVGVVLALEVVGLHARNAVWQTDESLWHDVAIKSPANGRGLMNYGLARMSQGDYQGAVDLFTRALAFTPTYSLLHINLGIAYGGEGRAVDAEREFHEALALEPNDWRSHFYYGRWLVGVGRSVEAVNELGLASAANPLDAEARSLLVQVVGPQADQYLNQSLAEYQAGKYRECIQSATEAIKIRPNFAEAYNNIAAAHNALGEWDAGIAAAQEAVRLSPNLQLARNNLAYALAHKPRVP